MVLIGNDGHQVEADLARRVALDARLDEGPHSLQPVSLRAPVQSTKEK